MTDTNFSDTNFSAPIEIKFLAEAGVFEGYASVFDVIDNVNDRIVPGAFAASLAAWRAEGCYPPMLWQHDTKQPIGAWTEMREDGHGLYVKGRLFVDEVARAREAYALLREGVVTGLSIGYRARGSYREASGARVLTEIELLEVSMVTFPANDRARIAPVKSEREFEAFLREAGFSRKQARGVIARGYKALFQRDAEEEDEETLEAMRAFTAKLWELAGR